MMTRRAWSFGDDRQVSATAMITTRAVPALLPAHHRRVARTHATPKDFADPLSNQGWRIHGPSCAVRAGERPHSPFHEDDELERCYPPDQRNWRSEARSGCVRSEPVRAPSQAARPPLGSNRYSRLTPDFFGRHPAATANNVLATLSGFPEQDHFQAN